MQTQILLVEDQPRVREMTARLLECLGYSCTAVESGAAALHQLQQARFDIVLTDLVMPGMDGYELAETIKRQQLAPKVALVTGSLGDPDFSLLASLGIDAYLAKPFTLAQLEEMLRQLTIADPAAVA
jgi:CheY-like chemotaxis protein